MDRISTLPACSEPALPAFHLVRAESADLPSLCTSLLEKARAMPQAEDASLCGAEAKGGGKVAAPICFTKESCFIRKAAVDAIKSNIEGCEQLRIVDVPSLICVKTVESFFNIHGENKNATPWVALVALGPIEVTFLSHERKDASVFDDVITKLPHEPGKGNPFFTQEVTEALTSDHFLILQLEAGDIFITHRGMPLWVIGEGGYQLVHTRILAPNSQIHEAYAKLLTTDKGVMPSAGHFGEPGLMHDVLVAKSIKGFEETYVPSVELVKPEEVPWLTTKEPPKKAPRAKAEAAQPPQKEPVASPTEVKPPVASPPAVASAPPSGAAKQLARHLEIEARIAKLNERVWDSKSEGKAKEHRGLHDSEPANFKLTSYKRVLDTLEDNVKKAEELLALLPEYDQNLEELVRVCAGITFKSPEVTQLAKDMRKLKGAEGPLTEQRKKKLVELLESAKKIAAGAPPAALAAAAIVQKPRAVVTFIVPDIKRDAYEPNYISGEEALDVLKDLKRWSEKQFQPMVSRYKAVNPKLADLYEEYQREYQRLERMEEDNGDFAYAIALHSALETLYKELSAKAIQEKKEAEAEAAKKAAIGNGRTQFECEDNLWGRGCGDKHPVHAFKQCKKCFCKNVATEAAWLNDCALDLKERADLAKAEREAENPFEQDQAPTELEQDVRTFISLTSSLMENCKKLERKNMIPDFVSKLEKAQAFAEKYGCAMDEDEEGEEFVGGVEDLQDDDDDDGDEEEEEDEEDDSIVCGDDEVSYKSENSLPSESFSSSSSASRRKKNKKRSRSPAREEADDLEAFKGKVALRLIKQQRRAPNLPLIKRCVTRFEKEDLQSIQWVDVNLREVENATQCFVIMAKPTSNEGATLTETPFMFLTEEEAEEKRQDLQNATASLHYSVQTKNF